MADSDDERFRAEIERLPKRLEWISAEEAHSAMEGDEERKGMTSELPPP